MTPLTINPLRAKGSLVSPANREIHDYLREHGPVKLSKLQERFRNLALASGKGGPSWLIARLNYLREHGHVCRILDGSGNASWDIVREQVDTRDPEPVREHVALPRRVDMFGPVYVAPKIALRPGAMDHADVPSLHMGRREPFRGSR